MDKNTNFSISGGAKSALECACGNCYYCRSFLMAASIKKDDSPEVRLTKRALGAFEEFFESVKPKSVPPLVGQLSHSLCDKEWLKRLLLEFLVDIDVKDPMGMGQDEVEEFLETSEVWNGK